MNWPGRSSALLGGVAAFLRFTAVLGAAEPPIFISPITKIQAADRDAGDQFGVSVAITTNLAVVGAYWDDDRGQSSGSAYVFERQPSTSIWRQTKKLNASDAQMGDWFGVSVAAYGDTIAIGASLSDPFGVQNTGAVYIYERHRGGTNAWGERQKISALQAAPDDWFGWSVQIQNRRLAVGAYQPTSTSGSGAVYLFGPGDSGWTQQQRLVATNEVAGAWFGWSIALHNDRLAVGAPLGGTPRTGAAYVFAEDSGSGLFVLDQRVTATEAESGDQFGWSLAMEGQTLAVGARHTNFGTNDTGAIYVFTRGSTSWDQSDRLRGADTVGGDWFGESVALKGNILLAGVRLADPRGNSSGAAYLFRRSETTSKWVEARKLTGADTGAEHRFGESIALDNDTLLIGSFFDPAPSFGFAEGAAYLFTYGASPRLEIRAVSTGLVIDWDATGSEWQLEATTGLGHGAWTNVIGGTMPPVSLSAPGESLFYRLRRSE